MVAAFAAILVVAVGVPTLALGADRVDNILGQVGAGDGSGSSAGSGAASSGGSVSDKAGVPPTYTPPLHGTDPHGQGTIATVDLTPEATNPYGSDPTTSGEEVVVGDTNGTQSGGSYHGRVTVLWLFGNPVIQVTSNPGESNDGPLQPLQDGLDQLCDGSGGQVCLTVLGMHSSSTDNSSTNSFELLGAHLGGDGGLLVDVGQSNGNISSDGNCQTAHGDSSVANVDAGGSSVAKVLQGSSTSTACNGQAAGSPDNSSTVLALGGNGLPIPVGGCADGTPNSVFDSLSPLLATVCNADDSNGSQASAPYGVREALALFALINDGVPGGALLRVTAGSAESHAVAPGPTTTEQPPTTGTQGTKGAGGKGGNGGNGGNEGGNGNGAGNGGGGAANQAAAGNGSLAFTGADLLVLGLVGGALILGGLALTTLAGRSHRQTV